MRTAAALLFTAAVTTAALTPAQAVSLEFAPNPAPPGVPITFTLTDSTGVGRALPTRCTWLRIRAGSQRGPDLGLSFFCPPTVHQIPPNGTFSLLWDQLDRNQQSVPWGTYWIETITWDPTLTSVTTDWFCLSVQHPNAPSLTAAGPAAVGQITPLQIALPGSPGGLYWCGLSLDSRNPATILGLRTCLSLPITGDACLNAFGSMDGMGNSHGLQLLVPNLPALRHRGLQLQALLLDPNGIALTNPLSLTVR